MPEDPQLLDHICFLFPGLHVASVVNRALGRCVRVELPVCGLADALNTNKRNEVQQPAVLPPTTGRVRPCTMRYSEGSVIEQLWFRSL